MFFLKHVSSTVTSPLDEEDPIEFLKVGLGFSSLMKPVINIIQELITTRRRREDLRTEQGHNTIVVAVQRHQEVEDMLLCQLPEKDTRTRCR